MSRYKTEQILVYSSTGIHQNQRLSNETYLDVLSFIEEWVVHLVLFVFPFSIFFILYFFYTRSLSPFVLIYV